MDDDNSTRIFASDPSERSSMFNGLKTLIVEDELLVSMLIEDILTELGCVVIGTAASVNEALSHITGQSEIDVAILDVNLGCEKSFPIADALIARGVPFIFATGFGPADIVERYPETPLLHKPYVPKSLASVLSGLTKH